MMKNKVKLIVILIVVAVFIDAFLLYILFSNSETKYVKTSKADDITRYEWIEMLCEQVGMTEYQNSEPYFKDVEKDSRYFSYIQSAYEWEIIDEALKFDGDALVSGEFVALTAMKTIGPEKIQIYHDTEDDITEQVYINVAIENGLIEEKQLSQGLSKEQCEQVLEKLGTLYFGAFWKDDYSKIKYQKGVIELFPEDVLQSNADCSEITVKQDIADSLEIGTIIVFEQSSTKLKVARKVEAIKNGGILTLSVAELEQVVESLVVSDITKLSFEDILNYYGLEGQETAANNPTLKQMSVFPIEEESEGFKLSLSTAGEGENRFIEIEICNNKTGCSFILPIREKIGTEGDYSAEIDIKKISVGGQVNYSGLNGGLKYADVALDVQNTMKGEIRVGETEKKFLLFKTPVPLGSGMIGIDIEIYLVFGLDGSISFEAKLPMEMAVHYEKGKGIRNFGSGITVSDAIVNANCTASVKLQLEPVLALFDCVDIMDLEAEAGAEAKATITNHENSQICVDISVAVPVITLSVCADKDKETLLGQVITIKWEIVSFDKAPKKNLHYEQLPNGTTQFVEECTYGREENPVNNDKTEREKTTETNTSESDNQSDDGDATDLSRFYGYDLPLCFSLDYTENDENDSFEFSIIDTGSYYLVKGSLICPEFVSCGEVGTHFVTGSGRGYTVIREESYNNDQRQKIILSGDDGKTYEIVNLPAHGMDVYTGAMYYNITSEDASKSYQTIFENVTLRIDYDTVFTNGEWVGDTFDSCVKKGCFENVNYNIEYDIHFTEDGKIDILMGGNGNGMFGGPNTENWISTLE